MCVCKRKRNRREDLSPNRSSIPYHRVRETGTEKRKNKAGEIETEREM